MLPQRVITKKQKKEASKKRLGLILFFLGLIVIVLCLFYLTFLEKKPTYVSPLAKDQSSFNSKLEKKLKEKNISYKSIETEKDLSFLVKLNDDQEVIIDPRKQIDQQLSSLQLILNQLKIEGKAFKRLDFRFSKPIISF